MNIRSRERSPAHECLEEIQLLGMSMQPIQREFGSFEWDEDKRKANLLKHGIDFEDAVVALHQPHIEWNSNRNGEVRTVAICPDAEKLIAILYVARGEICRIISVRTAHKNEQRKYHESFA